jgi:hypothetical protein
MESAEVYSYCLKNVNRYNSICYAGVGIIGKKNTEFWINFQRFLSKPFPKFDTLDEKWGFSIGFSSPLRFKK